MQGFRRENEHFRHDFRPPIPESEREKCAAGGLITAGRGARRPRQPAVTPSRMTRAESHAVGVQAVTHVTALAHYECVAIAWRKHWQGHVGPAHPVSAA